MKNRTARGAGQDRHRQLTLLPIRQLKFEKWYRKGTECAG